ncbi:MAG: hypothetical protein NT058_00875, partial [Candidatus Portnoybacteria bacterium]|nr:hypothetical protein [Candidatus Portnoybacteria bacterium]
MKTNIFANDFISICRNSKLAKCINLITMLSLVIWSFGPGIAIMVPKAHAEEVPSITETVEAPTTVEEIVPVIETPTTEEQVTPVAEAQPTETEEITTPEKTTPAESNVTQESQPVLSVWTNDGNKYTTTNTVELGTTYTSPQNDQVTVTFTKLPENPGKLSIEEITLTAEQITLLSALSDKAYDITSDMADGTFAFDLNLPKPANQENVQIKFAETEAELENAETVATNDITTEADSISVSLNHFTIFVVTKDETPLTGQVCINAG